MTYVLRIDLIDDSIYWFSQHLKRVFLLLLVIFLFAHVFQDFAHLERRDVDSWGKDDLFGRRSRTRSLSWLSCIFWWRFRSWTMAPFLFPSFISFILWFRITILLFGSRSDLVLSILNFFAVSRSYNNFVSTWRFILRDLVSVYRCLGGLLWYCSNLAVFHYSISFKYY